MGCGSSTNNKSVYGHAPPSANSVQIAPIVTTYYEDIAPEVGFVIKTLSEGGVKVFINLLHHFDMAKDAFLSSPAVISRDRSDEECHIYNVVISSRLMLDILDDETLHASTCNNAITYVNKTYNAALLFEYKLPKIAKGYMGDEPVSLRVTKTRMVSSSDAASLRQNVPLKQKSAGSMRRLFIHEDEVKPKLSHEEKLKIADSFYNTFLPCVAEAERTLQVKHEKIAESDEEARGYDATGIPLLIKGMLKKQGHITLNWLFRQFVVEAGVLSYYEDADKCHPWGKKLKDRIPLSGYTVRKISANRFHIFSEDDTVKKKDLLLICEAKEGDAEAYVDIWINMISKHIKYANTIFVDGAELQLTVESSETTTTTVFDVNTLASVLVRQQQTITEEQHAPTTHQNEIAPAKIYIKKETFNTNLVLYTPAMKCGWMRKEGHVVHNWKRRFFVLDSGYLTYFVDSIVAPPFGSALKGRLDLTKATVTKNVANVKCLIVVQSADIVDKPVGTVIEYESESIRDDWVVALNEHIAFATKSFDMHKHGQYKYANIKYHTYNSIIDRNMYGLFLLHEKEQMIATATIAIKSPFTSIKQLIVTDSNRFIIADPKLLEVSDQVTISKACRVLEIDKHTVEIVANKTIRFSDDVNGCKFWCNILNSMIADM